MSYRRKTSEINNHFHMIPKEGGGSGKNGIQSGRGQIQVGGEETVVYDRPFSSTPILVITLIVDSNDVAVLVSCHISAESKTGFTVQGRYQQTYVADHSRGGDVGGGGTDYFNWVAIPV